MVNGNEDEVADGSMGISGEIGAGESNGIYTECK